MAIRVRAKRMGYIGLKRQKEGAVFEIDDMQQYSDKWMELVDGPKVSVAVGVDLKQGASQSSKK